MQFPTEKAARELACSVGQRMWERGFVTATDGNLSARIEGDRLIFTPSGRSLGKLRAKELVVTNLEGVPLKGQGTRTAEYRLHLVCYSARPDIGAVVHAHPPYSTALTIAGVSLAGHILPEVVHNLGTIPTAAYATPCSPESAEAVRELIRVHDAVLLDRHGTVTVDATLEGAYMKLEKVEHAARVLAIATQLGATRLLPREEVEKIKEQGVRAGAINRKAVPPDPGSQL